VSNIFSVYVLKSSFHCGSTSKLRVEAPEPPHIVAYAKKRHQQIRDKLERHYEHTEGILIINSLCLTAAYYFRYFALGRGAKYCDEYVCLSVCPLAYLRINFFLHVACGCGCGSVLAQSSSGGITICYVLPVLWMACFYIMGPMVHHIYS